MIAKIRKHYAAFTALVVFHFVFFFPLLFMGRVVSPNDVYYNYEPWATFRPASIQRIQNALLNDPPTSYVTVISLIRDGLDAFHWNPYIGSGVPGWGASAAPSLTPFVLIPGAVLPFAWIYTGIIFLKLNLAFWFAYLWLREERLGKRGAAVGAMVIAAAGIYSTRWLWQMTNATALYPALLWVVARSFNGKRTSIAVVSLIALAYALAGFPSAMAYGAYLVLAYVVVLAIRAAATHKLKRPAVHLAGAAAGTLVALAIASPSLAAFAQFIRRSGYLALRDAIGGLTYPWSHWHSFLDPERLGNPAFKNWIGDPALGYLNNFWEATIYVGIFTIMFAAVAILDRRHVRRWFWLATAAVVIAIMFGAPGIAAVARRLPGIKYTALSRLSLLLPLPAGYLAGCGSAFLLRQFRSRWRPVAVILSIAAAGAVAADLGVFAGGFYPYLEPHDAELPATPVIRYLQRDQKPFRFAAFLGYMWPNSAELYRIEDIASHFGSEASYRKLLQRVDPESWSGRSTVIQFNSLKFNFTDPIVSMLGVRYFLEHKQIDIIKWTIFGATVPAVKERGAFLIAPGLVAQRTIRVDAEPFWAIEVPVSVDRTTSATPTLRLDLLKNGVRVWSRVIHDPDIRAMSKTYIPLRPFARAGDVVTIRLQPRGMWVALLRGDAPAGESPMYYGRVTIPLVFETELPDGRIFRNLAEVPRFHAVKRLRKMDRDEFLATRDIDFAEEAVITDDPVFPPAVVAQDARVKLVHYASGEQRLTTESSGAMFLASSEKLTPELAVTIDGRRVRPVEINTMFAGVNVPAGHHEVRFTRRIGRGWWPLSFASLFVFFAIAAVELTAALLPR